MGINSRAYMYLFASLVYGAYTRSPTFTSHLLLHSACHIVVAAHGLTEADCDAIGVALAGHRRKLTATYGISPFVPEPVIPSPASPPQPVDVDHAKSNEEPSSGDSSDSEEGSSIDDRSGSEGSSHSGSDDDDDGDSDDDDDRSDDGSDGGSRSSDGDSDDDRSSSSSRNSGSDTSSDGDGDGSDDRPKRESSSSPGKKAVSFERGRGGR